MTSTSRSQVTSGHLSENLWHAPSGLVYEETRECSYSVQLNNNTDRVTKKHNCWRSDDEASSSSLTFFPSLFAHPPTLFSCVSWSQSAKSQEFLGSSTYSSSSSSSLFVCPLPPHSITNFFPGMDEQTPRIGAPFPFMCPTSSPSSAVFPPPLHIFPPHMQQQYFLNIMQLVQQQQYQQRLSSGGSPVNSDQASSRSESPQTKSESINSLLHLLKFRLY